MSVNGMGEVKALAERLKGHQLMAERGYEVSVNDKGDLLVCRRGHWRGMWRYSSGQFSWIIAGSREQSYQADEIDLAEAYSIKNIFVE